MLLLLLLSLRLCLLLEMGGVLVLRLCLRVVRLLLLLLRLHPRRLGLGVLLLVGEDVLALGLEHGGEESGELRLTRQIETEATAATEVRSRLVCPGTTQAEGAAAVLPSRWGTTVFLSRRTWFSWKLTWMRVRFE